MNYKLIETKLNDKCLKHNNPYIPNNYYNIEQVLSIGDIHGDFTLLLNILFKCNIIKIIKNPKEININQIIHIKYLEYLDKPLIDYYVEINTKLDNILIIQVGDIMDIRESTNTNFKDNSEKIIKFIEKLSKRINILNKNYHFISLFGNHELNHIIKDKKNKFIYDNKYNFICNYKLIVNVNDNYVFVHSGLIKEKMIKYFDKYIKPNMTMRDKINIFNIIFNYILLKNYLKNNKYNEKDFILKILSIRQYERPEKYNILPYKKLKGVNVYNFNKYQCNLLFSKLSSENKYYCPKEDFNNFINHYKFYTLNNMIIGHNAGYQTDIIEYDNYDKKNKIFIIDNLKSRAYNENTTYYNNNIPCALLLDVLNNNYSFIY